ncbi:MAG: sulfite exporter TauE/SafE family protein [Verrucomicrobiota bacterium]|nr:sulfite exporter TauE/SafE family protein [Verrucomicrobiota bacterium]
MAAADWLIPVSILAAAFLYSSVGHGGASAYLAVMALAGVAPQMMRPAALTMNLFVSGMAFFHYKRAGWFSWSIFWPFAITAVPLSFLGAKVLLPNRVFHILLGCVLLFAAIRLLGPRSSDVQTARPLNRGVALGLGGVLGLLSGMTGVGGGIFLSPVLVISRWASVKTASAVAAAFIFVNSIAGLCALSPAARILPMHFGWWLAAAILGGWTGARLGSSRFHAPLLMRLLGAVLLLASAKLIFS